MVSADGEVSLTLLSYWLAIFKLTLQAILFRLVEIVIEIAHGDVFDKLVNHLLICKQSIGAIDEAHVELYEDSIEDFVQCVKNIKCVSADGAVAQLKDFFESELALHAIYCTRV